MGRHRLFGIVAIGVAALAAGSGPARAQQFSAVLSGFAETGLFGTQETGAILTTGTGTLSLDLDKTAQMATYTLTFSRLTSPATMGHIHFGQQHVPGGILVWLCQTKVMPSPVAGTPFCPTAGGTVTGTITAKDIVSIPGENVRAGDFHALQAALDTNTAYANVHSIKIPTGEIRGQIMPSVATGQ
jgi:CHRD domain